MTVSIVEIIGRSTQGIIPGDFYCYYYAPTRQEKLVDAARSVESLLR